jgi:hypothetical protein
MRTRIKLIPFILLFTLLAFTALSAACGPTAEQASPTIAGGETADAGIMVTSPPASASGAYPAPTTTGPASPYPAEGEIAAPATSTPGAYPPAEETFLEPRFRFDQPITAGTTIITGQAPPGVALALLDVTYNGALLGSGRSDESGRFSISVTGLVEGNRIGISIAELAEGQTLNQMAEQYYPYRGEGFMNLPNVGVFFDTIQVQP